MNRESGDSYYVLVDKNGNVYELEDLITGYTETYKFNSWEDAEKQLTYLIDEEMLNANDGWHVERHRW